MTHFQNSGRASVPPPPSVGFPRRGGPVAVPRLHPPPPQVLGQERRDPAQGHPHARAARVRTGCAVHRVIILLERACLYNRIGRN